MTVFASHSNRRWIAAIALLTVLLGLFIAAMVVARHGRSSGRTLASGRVNSPLSPTTSASQSPPSKPHAMPVSSRSDNPVRYARAVATTLFTVNPAKVTRQEFLEFWRRQLPTVVYSDAAAKGLTLSAQNADALANLTHGWIPSHTVWASEAADKIVSNFSITSVSVPDYWNTAVADGTLTDPGLHMERVTGVLTQRYGLHHRYASRRSVVIDLGLLCGPTQPGGCRLVAPQDPGSPDS